MATGGSFGKHWVDSYKHGPIFPEREKPLNAGKKTCAAGLRTKSFLTALSPAYSPPRNMGPVKPFKTARMTAADRL